MTYIYIIKNVNVKKSPAKKHIQKIPNKQEGIKDVKKHNYLVRLLLNNKQPLNQIHLQLLNKASIYSECKIGHN